MESDNNHREKERENDENWFLLCCRSCYFVLLFCFRVIVCASLVVTMLLLMVYKFRCIFLRRKRKHDVWCHGMSYLSLTSAMDMSRYCMLCARNKMRYGIGAEKFERKKNVSSHKVNTSSWVLSESNKSLHLSQVTTLKLNKSMH